MDILQKNAAALFRCVQPETLYRSIISGQRRISAAHIDADIFSDAAYSQYMNYSHEEVRNIFSLALKDGSINGSFSVFNLLYNTARSFLCHECGELVFEFSRALEWRYAYQELGQDIFTASFLALEDLKHSSKERIRFTWDAVIRSNNRRLNIILRKGLAENHCHLGGTTQNFALSWACLMNFPEEIRREGRKLDRNLQANYTRGVSGNVWSWERRLLWAAFLRLELFRNLVHCAGTQNFFMEDAYFYPKQYVRHQLEALRFQYGASFRYKGERDFVLDYALRRKDCRDFADDPNRLLSGERSFLYRCFRACFDGTFDEFLQTWLYMYLLIKSNFRAEIVQVNRQPGFRNFMEYQDRKSKIYGSIPGYKAEAVRLAVNASRKSQNIRSFEIRTAPSSHHSDMYREILFNRTHIDSGELTDNCRVFYVYHFIKQPDKSGTQKHFCRPRNSEVRRNCRIQSGALARMLKNIPDAGNYVYGIDAANLEVGCRPETFGTEFRYLKSLGLHATYHAGEDFLDIADGLRAVDEAVNFLGMKRNDRIGHALALGVSPEIHYRFKNNFIAMPKQDMLDNIVWLLFRSNELNVSVNSRLRSVLTIRAENLLYEIYGKYISSTHHHVNLYDYYCSMKLRGDLPELYRVLPYKSHPPAKNYPYSLYAENGTEGLKSYRNSEVISGLCQCYHYSAESRKAGNDVAELYADSEYTALIRNMQEGLAKCLADKGIMIECNPTSNCLIGTFREYRLHPVFRFNSSGLASSDGNVTAGFQLSVSVNTDDLGIFDTSLENEYLLLAACLEREAGENSEAKYIHDSIYRYIDNLRIMGLEQSFIFAEENAYREMLSGETLNN